MSREDCHFCDETEALDRHHIVPKRHGGSDSDENLVTVCPTCHRKLEQLYDRRFYQEVTDRDIQVFSPVVRSFFDDVVCECAENRSYDWADPFDIWLNHFQDHLHNRGFKLTDAFKAELLSAFHQHPRASVRWYDGSGNIEILGPNPADAGACECSITSDQLVPQMSEGEDE